MASQVSPGVIIRESDLSNAVVVGDVAITAAFASSFRKGPVGKIVNVSSEKELIETFGTPAEANAADWLVASEFLRYGGNLAVVRATTGVKTANFGNTGNHDRVDNSTFAEIRATGGTGSGATFKVVTNGDGAAR